MSWVDRFLKRSPSPKNEPPVETTRVRDGRTAVHDVEEALGATRAGSLPEAVGSALAGQRVFVDVTSNRVDPALLTAAVERHVPLVVHVGGVDAHAVADHFGEAGAFVLFAANVQQAADFTMIARTVTENTLVPGVVAMDERGTASSLQDVRFLSAATLLALAGRADEGIASPTPAQRLLFGKSRRRVPRWFDPTRPISSGAVLDSWSRAPAAVAHDAYFGDATATFLVEAVEAFEFRTGRRPQLVRDLQRHDAEVVFVAAGAIAEAAEVVANYLRTTHGTRVDVLGVRLTRPWPAERVAQQLRGVRSIIVLEPFGPSGQGPLGTAVRLAVAATGQPARVVCACCGHGDSPIRVSDLARLGEEIELVPDRVVVGLEFFPPAIVDPKRQALLDRLEREYPHLSERSVRAVEPVLLGDKKLRTLRCFPSTSAITGHFAREAVTLLHAASDRGVRVVDEPGEGFRLVLGAGDPGDDAACDVAWIELSDDVAPDEVPRPLERAVELVRPRGRLVVVAPYDPGPVVARLPFVVQRTLRDKRVEVRTLRIGGAGGEQEAFERGLGALVFATDVDADRAVRARSEMLSSMDGEQRVRLEDAFRFARDYVHRFDLDSEFEPTGALVESAEIEPPAQVRRLARADDRYDSLPRLWDQVGVLDHEGRRSDLVPEPGLALRTMAPLSSVFRTRSNSGRTLPKFDPTCCTGCAQCWITCPDGAVVPGVFGAREVLEHGIQRATEKGANVSALRSIVAQLVASMERAESAPATFGEGALRAFDELGVPEARRSALREALEEVVREVGPLRVARTKPFFEGAHRLLAVAVDPDACQGCGACVEACEPGALVRSEREEATVSEARRLAVLLSELPDPSEETIAAAAAHADVGRAGATLLARRFRATFAAGTGSEPGSGVQLALRLVIAAVVAARHGHRGEHLAKLEDLQRRFAEEVRSGLLDAVPVDDLDAIADGLRVLGRRDLDVAELVERLEDACDSDRVDGARLGRVVDAAREVSDLKDRLERSDPAPFGLVLIGESIASWAAAFPHNPFAVPTVVASADEGFPLALGLTGAFSGEGLRTARSLRRAVHVLENRNPDVPLDLPETWSELMDEETRVRTPLVVVCAAEDWEAQQGSVTPEFFGASASLLTVVLSADAASAARVTPPREVPIVQSTVAHADHLVSAVSDALAAGAPAWVHVLGPDPARAGIDPEEARAEAARRVAEGTFRLVPAGESVGETPEAELAPAPPSESIPDAEAARHEMAERLTRRLMALAGWDPKSGGRP